MISPESRFPEPTFARTGAPVEFTFVKSSCVAIGTFNIYIIQPKLLAEMGVVAESWNGELSGDLVQPGIRFSNDAFAWNVRPDRVSVESVAIANDCGASISKLLKHLSWTPVFAIGANAVFHSPLSGESSLPPGFSFPFNIVSGTEQRTCHVAVRRDEVVFNIQMSITEDVIELLLNAHVDFAAYRQKHPQRDSNKRVLASCDKFMSYRAEAMKLASQLTGGEFLNG